MSVVSGKYSYQSKEAVELFESVISGDTETLKSLLKSESVNPNSQRTRKLYYKNYNVQETALHVAIYRNCSLSVIDLLLEYGGDPFIQANPLEEKNLDSLRLAKKNNRGDVVDLILNHLNNRAKQREKKPDSELEMMSQPVAVSDL